MSNPPSTGRLLNDEGPQPARPRPIAVPPSPFGDQHQADLHRIAPPAAAAPSVPLQPAQRACYEALGLALQEGHVFAAVTGPEGSGKSTVLEAVLADRHDRALRCIRISDPDKVPARLAAQIEQVAYAEAGKPENLERHVVLAIDDAHTASNELLRCLARLAAMREPGRRVPQVLLVGRPELWGRLATEEYAPLARRLAVRAVLPTLQDEQDPWASLEQEVSQTMSQLRAESEHLPAPVRDQAPRFERAYGDMYPTTVEEAGLPFDAETVPLPTDFALFPDPPAHVEPRQRESKRRLMLPLGCLLVAVAAFTFLLSYFDWPGLFDDMPWADGKPANTFAFAPQSNPSGPAPSAPWTQQTQYQAQATLPRGAPPPPSATHPETAAIAALPSASVPAPPAPASQPIVPSSPADLPAAAALATQPAIKPPTPAPLMAAEPSPVEPAKPAEPPKPIEAAIKPQEPPKPVVTQAIEPSRMVPPPPPHTTPAPAPIVQASTVAPEPAKPAAAPSAAEAPMTVAAVAAPPLSATASRSNRSPPTAMLKPGSLPPAIIGLLLRRGDEQLAIGDVSAARLLFERAAESGNAQGAFRLARTYDTSYLPPSDAATLANRSEARVWYGRAASLGDRDAAARLRDLNEGH